MIMEQGSPRMLLFSKKVVSIKMIINPLIYKFDAKIL